jgi:hypothetical protein
VTFHFVLFLRPNNLFDAPFPLCLTLLSHSSTSIEANIVKVQCVICEDWFHGLCLKPPLANEAMVEVWEKKHGMEWTCPNCMGADEDSE